MDKPARRLFRAAGGPYSAHDIPFFGQPIMRHPLPAVLLLTAALSSCGRVGPDFLRPGISLQEAWHRSAATAASDLATAAWWRDLKDPVLNGLIARGLAQNLDILASRERIIAARATLGQAANPASGSLQAEASADLREGRDPGIVTASDLSLDAGWVFDIFGGMARERERAGAALEAAVAQAEAVRLAWLAEIVSAYMEALHQDEIAALHRESIKNREATINALRTQIEYGKAARIDLARAEALLNSAQAEVPVAEAARERAIFRIAALLDEDSGAIRGEMRRAALPRTPANPRIGVPADLLRNRPDIRVAEAELKAATAAIGMAEADLLPALRLSGSLTVTGKGAALGPGLTFPILNRGMLKAAREARVSEARSAEIAWRAAVNTAIEQVEVARVSLEMNRRSAAAHAAAAESHRATLELLRGGMESGEVPVTEILAVEESLTETLKDLAEARHAAARQWVALQIATGAGSAAENP